MSPAPDSRVRLGKSVLSNKREVGLLVRQLASLNRIKEKTYGCRQHNRTFSRAIAATSAARAELSDALGRLSNFFTGRSVLPGGAAVGSVAVDRISRGCRHHP